MEAANSFKVLVPMYRTSGRHVPVNRKRNICPNENLKFLDLTTLRDVIASPTLQLHGRHARVMDDKVKKTPRHEDVLRCISTNS